MTTMAEEAPSGARQVGRPERIGEVRRGEGGPTRPGDWLLCGVLGFAGATGPLIMRGAVQLYHSLPALDGGANPFGAPAFWLVCTVFGAAGLFLALVSRELHPRRALAVGTAAPAYFLGIGSGVPALSGEVVNEVVVEAPAEDLSTGAVPAPRPDPAGETPSVSLARSAAGTSPKRATADTVWIRIVNFDAMLQTAGRLAEANRPAINGRRLERGDSLIAHRRGQDLVVTTGRSSARVAWERLASGPGVVRIRVEILTPSSFEIVQRTLGRTVPPARPVVTILSPPGRAGA